MSKKIENCAKLGGQGLKSESDSWVLSVHKKFYWPFRERLINVLYTKTKSHVSDLRQPFFLPAPPLSTIFEAHVRMSLVHRRGGNGSSLNG